MNNSLHPDGLESWGMNMHLGKNVVGIQLKCHCIFFFFFFVFMCLFEKRDVLCYGVWRPSVHLSVNFFVSG